MPTPVIHPTTVGGSGTQTSLGLGKVLQLGLGLMSFLDDRRTQKLEQERVEEATTWSLLKGLYEVYPGNKADIYPFLKKYVAQYLGRGKNTTPELVEAELTKLEKEPPIGTDDILDTAFKTFLGYGPKEMIQQQIATKETATTPAPAAEAGPTARDEWEQENLPTIGQTTRLRDELKSAPLASMDQSQARRVLANYGGALLGEAGEPTDEQVRKGMDEWKDYQMSTPSRVARIKLPADQVKNQIDDLFRELELIRKGMALDERELRLLRQEAGLYNRENVLADAKRNLLLERLGLTIEEKIYKEQQADLTGKSEQLAAYLKSKDYKNIDEAYLAKDEAAMKLYEGWVDSAVESWSGSKEEKDFFLNPASAGEGAWADINRFVESVINFFTGKGYKPSKVTRPVWTPEKGTTTEKKAAPVETPTTPEPTAPSYNLKRLQEINEQIRKDREARRNQ